MSTIALGAVAGAIALTTADDQPKAPQWTNDLTLQRKYVGRNTANYLISTLEEIDAVLQNRMYKSSKWFVGTTYTGIPVMISSKGDFKIFKSRSAMLEMAHFFANDLPFSEVDEETLETYREKAGQVLPSVIDFVAEGQMDVMPRLPLGRLIRLDQRHMDLNDFKVRNQSWQLYAMSNGMFIAMRGSTNLTYRAFKDKESFWRFYTKAISKEKRYFLPSEELGHNLETVTTIDEENDLIACFLKDIVEVSRGGKQ